MTLLSIYDVACPYCGSAAGASCYATPSRAKRITPHRLRREAFILATKFPARTPAREGR